jgi:hypothetical protein
MVKSIDSFSTDSRPYGKTYGEWTVDWWKWALSSPKVTNPLIDETGKNAHFNQPANVWFLAGRFADERKDIPHRKITIPFRTSLLFPVINCEANTFEYPDLHTEQDLLEHVKNDENTIIKKECFVNDEKIPTQRVSSDPPVFNLTIAEDNPLGIIKTGITQAAADGYWVFLKPLEEGEYKIEFVGACELGKLNSGASYQVSVRY